VYDERFLKRYLLEELNQAEMQILEERLMVDNDLFDLLLFCEDEVVDDYVGGILSAKQRKSFENAFLSTPERRRKVSFATTLSQYASAKADSEPSPEIRPKRPSLWRQAFSNPYLRLAASAVIVLGLAFGVWRVCFRQSEVDKGIAALARAYRIQRPTEARVSEMYYAPIANTRSGEGTTVDEIFRSRAERILLDEVAEHPTSKAHHALGRFYLTQQKCDLAIEHLRTALTDNQQDAQLHSDIGAALLEKGGVDRRKPESGVSLEDLAGSVEHVSKALSLNGSLSEALFNLALCHQHMMLNHQAEEDWRKYLEHDANSLWAEEAKRNLKDLEEQESKSSLSKEQVLPELLEACQNKQEEKAWRLISENTEAITGRLFWWQLLGAFGNPGSKGWHAEPDADRIANQIMDALAFVGELEKQRTGDVYISELASFYKSSSRMHRTRLAQAHQLVNRGHGFCIQSSFDKALNAYTEARQQYLQAGDKWEAAFADYWIGYCYLQMAKTGPSRAVLKPLIEYSRRQNFLWLLSQAVNSFAGTQANTNELSRGIEFTEQALKISSQIEDTYAVQKNLTQLANYYKYVNDYQQALNQLNRSLDAARLCWPGSRQMWRTYDMLAEVLNASGYYAAAADCEREALSLVIDDPGFESVSYSHLGDIYERLQDRVGAVRLAQLGVDTVKQLADEPAGRSKMAYSTVQLGHIYRRVGDHLNASECYSRAIEAIKAKELRGRLDFDVVIYDAHKGRLLSYVAQGEDALAKQELQIVLELTEKYRSKILEEQNRNKFFDIEQSVYDVAIDFEYSKMHDPKQAFEWSEFSRARSLLDLINSQARVSSRKAERDIVIPYASKPLSLDEIMARLPERAQIVQYGVLDDKVLIWVISNKNFSVVESNISLKDLKEKTLAYCKAVVNDKEERVEESQELYDFLIAPVESLLDSTRQICIVADKVLNYLPFNTLVSRHSGRYMISDYTLSFSPSSSVFVLCSEDAARKSELTGGERLLSVGNPRIDSERFPAFRDLPSATKEANEIAAYYDSSRVLVEENAKAETVRREMEKSDVVHLASHYLVDERSPMRSKLLLARERGSTGHLDEQDGVLQAAEIYQQKPLRARLVVLSACQTAIEGYYNGEGAVGMSRTFIAAHIPLVVASLWPVDSDSTKELMISFHRYRKRGDPITARALRQAQLDMIGGSEQLYAKPKYWASFIVIGGYAKF
jgi:CHAT domain-containing protein